jgi:hypothetical protein
MSMEPRARTESKRQAWLEAHGRSSGIVLLVLAGFALPYGERVGTALAIAGAALLALAYEVERRCAVRR